MDYEEYEQDKKAIQSVGAQVQKSINSRLGKLRFRCMKAEDFDAEQAAGGHSVQQVTFVNRDGEIELWLGDIQLSFGGGIEGPVIETGIVLAEDQLTDWAPLRELLPVEFRGEYTAYYSGVPAHFVLQGHRCNAVPLNLNNVTPDDVVSELELTFRTGEKHKIVISIYKQEGLNLWLALDEYDTSGSTPVRVSGYRWTGYWQLPNVQYPGPIKIGFSISNVYFYTNSSGQRASRYWVNVWCFLGDTLATPVTVSGSNPREISGLSTLFTNHENVDFTDDAERNFAYGLATRTEPVYPNGGE